MRVVAANTTAFLVCFERRSGGAGVLVAEDGDCARSRR
jgi:hypothetical protein